ncbi:membrane protein, putative [Babesia bigemina]|uniref:Membrane protein, putative n=1 Tax=Babesia bigemina TaxID=5866 RepID=A0A061D733_BABBI|nr:membrane protein, putative [Babesia bigemina]CDR96323.1 membrane protein, putative [Babesia bigemina]|eukprot:XP_012768509.1 membrane protein, putative [Babesia bigemina]
MGFLIHLCRFVGVVSGFVVPVIAGLYAASVGNIKQANYFLRALIFWVILDRIFSPVLFAVLGIVSRLLWPLAFSIISVALVVPRTRVLEYGDKCTVMAIKKGKQHSATNAVCATLAVLRKHVENIVMPLLGASNHNGEKQE